MRAAFAAAMQEGLRLFQTLNDDVLQYRLVRHPARSASTHGESGCTVSTWRRPK
jgi:hypothetical protein